MSKEFPALLNDNILRAARGEPIDRIPVWVMRQAGRYLPEFQEVREKHEFFEVCRTPELACEVTLQPLKRFDLDAAIIFSDILVIPQALGMTVEMRKGVGPVFPEPLSSPDDFSKLNFEGFLDRLSYVGEAINKTRHALNGKVPLIGFTGAPWTLMGYIVEGRSCKDDMTKMRSWLTKHTQETHQLLDMLTECCIKYLVMQVRAGAQLLQVFESSADHLSKDEFLIWSLPQLKHIRTEVKLRLEKEDLPAVPMILFAKGAGHSLAEQSKLGYEVIGIDWSVNPLVAREQVGPDITLQGNLDPEDMLKSPEQLRALVVEMVQKFGSKRYIANLGHGITPQTPITSMETFTRTVHELSKK